MASAAFKSTTRRSLHGAASSDRSDQRPCPRRSRSRSVSAAPRGSVVDEDYSNTRANPLFDFTVSPSSSASPPPQPPGTATSSGSGDAARRERDRGREPLKGHVRGGGGGGRARSVSVAPQGRSTGSTSSADSSAAADGGRRSSSRARSVTGEVRPYRASETDAESRDMTRKLQSRRTRDSVVEDKHRGIQIHTSCSSQGSATEVQNHSAITVDPVLEIPPEFDPDSAEFIFDVSDYATEYRNEDVAEISLDSDADTVELALDIRGNVTDRGWEPIQIPLQFDPEVVELVSDMNHHDSKQQWEQMGYPLELGSDTSELTPDITEYTIKLKQSHERARKLRADLAVEEQREQELSRMLKDIVIDPNFSETHRKRPRRKSSIERLKVSRHLAEEAMNYFEECVSISTMDSTDFSSPDDPQPNSIVNVPPKNNSRLFQKGMSTFQGSHTETDRHGHLEESDNQTQCSISIIGSDMSDNIVLSRINAPGSKIRSNSNDDIDGFDTPRSRSSCFSFTHKPAKTIENGGVQQYLGNFGRGNNKDLKEMKSSYFADEYTFQKANLDLLTDMVTFQSRIEYGGLFICNTRTF